MRDATYYGQRLKFPDIDNVWNFDSFDVTEQNIKSQLAVLDDDKNPKSLELLTQLGHLEALRGKTAEAQKILDSVKVSLASLSDGTGARAEIRYLLEMGRVSCLTRMPDQAQSRFGKAWELAMTKGEDFLAIDAALMLAMTQPAKSQGAWLERALHVAVESKREEAKLWLYQIYTRRGWAFFDINQFDIALVDFQSALSRANPQDADQVTTAQWCIARTMRALNRVDEALELQKSIGVRLNPESTAYGYVAWEIAECNLKLNVTVDAQEHFDMALKILTKDEWFKDTYPADFSRLQYLAQKKFR